MREEQKDIFDEDEEHAPQKLCKKGAFNTVIMDLKAIKDAQLKIKETKSALARDYGKIDAALLIELAKLQFSGKYDTTVDKANGLEELYEEIFGDGEED